MEALYIAIVAVWCLGWFFKCILSEDFKDWFIMSSGACVLLTIGTIFFPQLFSSF